MIWLNGCHHRHLPQPYPGGLFPSFVCGKLLQLCLTFCDPTDCSPRGSSVHGIFQANILEWVAMPSSRGSFRPRNRTQTQGSNLSFLCLLHWQAGSLPLRRDNSSWEPKLGGQAGKPFLGLYWATIPIDNQCFPAPMTLSIVFPMPEMPFPAIFAW